MPVLHRCPLGHSWDAGQDHCPVCGWIVPADASTIEADPPGNPQSSTVDYSRSRNNVPVMVNVAGPPVPGYEVLGVLGKGGMGIVYKARQVKLDRLVALKMIRSGPLAGADELERFRAEARAVARLNHPNIVQIYEVGEHEGQAYLALEYLDGGSLKQKLAGNPQSVREAAELVRSLADGMQAAHEAGIVHRDLKPANVLLSTSYSVLRTGKISDFGLAKQLDSDAGQTRTGAVVGTPSYMAPEQAAGLTSAIGPAADIYGLGAILYEMITGRPPFRAATVWETLEQVRSHDPVPPRQLQPRCPRDLETICLKCLEKHPGRRYGTAHDLAEDLRRFLGGEPIRARPVSGVERLAKLIRRRPLITALIVALAVVFVAGFSFILQGYHQAESDRLGALEAKADALGKWTAAEEETRRANLERDRALEEGEKARLKEVQAGLSFYRNEISLAGAEWNADHYARTIDLLQRCPQALRHWEWHYLRRQTVTRAVTSQGGVCAAYSPDGRRLAYFRKGGRIEVREVESKRIVATLSGHEGEGLRLAFRPDGKSLVSVGRDDVVRLWNLETQCETLALPRQKAAVRSAAIHPDGRQVALLLSAGVVSVWDLEASRELYQHPGAGDVLGDCQAIAYSPDGKYLAAAGRGLSVKVWSVADGKEEVSIPTQTTPRTLAFHPDCRRLVLGRFSKIDVYDLSQRKYLLSYGSLRSEIMAVGFSPDGNRLAATNSEGAVRVWDFPSGENTEYLRGHDRMVYSLAFRPDGKQLATTGYDGRVRVWDLQSSQDALTWKIPDGCTMVRFTPDGKEVVTASTGGTVGFWNAETGTAGRSFLAHDHWALCVAISRDGKYLATGGSTTNKEKIVGEFKVWDAKTGAMLFSGPGHQEDVRSVAFSPDGKLVASAEAEHLKVWDTATGTQRLDLPGIGQSVAFSPDGKHLAAISRKTDEIDLVGASHLHIHRVADGGQVLRARVGSPRSVLWLQYSPDGSQVLLAGGEWSSYGEVVVLTAATGKEVMALRGHSDIIISAAISPDGQRLVTAGKDGFAKIWDLRPNAAPGSCELLSLAGHYRSLVSAEFSPDGNRVVTGDPAGFVKVWDGRPLTPEEEKEHSP